MAWWGGGWWWWVGVEAVGIDPLDISALFYSLPLPLQSECTATNCFPWPDFSS